MIWFQQPNNVKTIFPTSGNCTKYWDISPVLGSSAQERQGTSRETPVVSGWLESMLSRGPFQHLQFCNFVICSWKGGTGSDKSEVWCAGSNGFNRETDKVRSSSKSRICPCLYVSLKNWTDMRFLEISMSFLKPVFLRQQVVHEAHEVFLCFLADSSLTALYREQFVKLAVSMSQGKI